MNEQVYATASDVPVFGPCTPEAEQAVRVTLKEWWTLVQTYLPHGTRNEIETFGFIAGGALRSALMREPIKDYDIFFDNAHSADDAARYLDAVIEAKALVNDPYPFKRAFQTENAHSFYFRWEGVNYQIQFVKRYYDAPLACVKKFDFTHSMGYYSFGDDTLVVTPEMRDALRDKTLVFNPDCYSPTHSSGRAAKFIKQGWTIDKESLQMMAWAVGKEATGLSTEEEAAQDGEAPEPLVFYPSRTQFKQRMSSRGGY